MTRPRSQKTLAEEKENRRRMDDERLREELDTLTEREEHELAPVRELLEAGVDWFRSRLDNEDRSKQNVLWARMVNRLKQFDTAIPVKPFMFDRRPV